MAADDVRTEFHLTPGGWITGTERLFSRPTGDEVPRPEGAVVTFEHREFDSSNFGPTHFSVKEIWRSASATDGQIRDLLEQHGSPQESNWAGARPWESLPLRYKR